MKPLPYRIDMVDSTIPIQKFVLAVTVQITTEIDHFGVNRPLENSH